MSTAVSSVRAKVTSSPLHNSAGPGPLRHTRGCEGSCHIALPKYPHQLWRIDLLIFLTVKDIQLWEHDGTQGAVILDCFGSADDPSLSSNKTNKILYQFEMRLLKKSHK